MKKVMIRSVKVPDKSSCYIDANRYTIFLGNGVTMYYTTSKDHRYALAEINRRLNVILFELNELWIFGWSEYRRVWYILLANDDHYDRQLMEMNIDLTRLFRLITERSSWVNGNVFSFKYLDSINESLTGLFKLLVKIRTARKQYLEVHLIETKLRTLKVISESLINMKIEPRYSTKGYSKSNGFRHPVASPTNQK